MNFFTRIVDYLKSSSSSFPLMMGIILSVAFITMLIVILVTLISIKKETIKSKRILNLPPSAFSNDNQESNNKKNKEINNKKNTPLLWLFGEKINRFLIEKGYIQADQIIRSFFKATQYLKKTLGIKYKYTLPLFMIVGSGESGKSSLLRGFTHDDFVDEDNNLISWWFLKNGIVLDVRGDIFIPQSDYNSSNKAWDTILHVLYRYRNKKPINGIILTISATELYGKNKLSIDDIKKQAQYVARKLCFIQLYFGLKLPIYIVITKTDAIPGFQSFCSELPVRNRNNMLGWSSPFTLDTMYNPNILDMAFADLENELNEIRIEIFSENLISNMKDGVFVFPSELLTIKESLCCYINTIFKDSAISENGYFRGFYFTGDSKMVPLEQLSLQDENSTGNEPTAMAIMGTPDADVNEAGSISASFQDEQYIPKRIFFFEDLLLKKILVEYGIAKPMRVKLHQANKTIFIAKVATAAFAIIGTYGLFSAKDQLNYSKNNLFPVLYKLSYIIKESSNLNLKTLNTHGNEILADCSNQLLSLMQQLNRVRLYSFFVPASWFSSINDKLKDTLKVSYQKVIVRTIYINLLLKAKSLLQKQETQISNTLIEVLNPEKSKEYLQLKQYVFDFLELEKNIKKFDALRTSADPKDLGDLIQYTFKGSLPSEFLDNYKDFRMILMNTPFPSLDLSPHRQVVYNILFDLFQNFIDSIFTIKSNNNLVIQVKKFINKLTRQNIKRFPNCKEIKQFSNSLTKACGQLGKEGKTWLDKQVFEPNKEYKSLLGGIEILFGRNVVDQMTNMISDYFTDLQKQILKLNDILANNINNKVNNIKKKKAITSGIFQLERGLKDLCSEGFMEEPADYELITEIPEGKMIYWDDELVQYATDIGKRYEEFIVSYINELPKCIQEGIGLVAKTNLYEVIASIIAKSQSLVDVPVGITNQITSEEILQRQISELKGVAPKLTKLLQILRTDQFGFVFGNLRTVLNKIGFSLLNHVDNLLEDQSPYMPINLTFDYWNGDAGAGLDTYSSTDMEEFDLYIQLQRNLITRLALDFAKTLVDFLNSEYVYDKNYGSHTQLTKWTRIVNNVIGFSKKDPRNSIKILENFIKNTLNTYTIDNILNKVSIEDIKKDTGDYFLNIVQSIKKGILARAEVLIRQRNIVRYERLRDYYERHLERFYPFSDYDTTQRVAKDADLDSVREFFRMYDEFGGSPENILEQIYQLDEGKEVYYFLQKIHILKELFGDLLKNQFESLKVRVEANFNVNKREESNTDYLVDRIFKPNNDTNIEAINPDRSGAWYFGEPIEFDLRWAEDDTDAQKPRYNAKDPDLIIDGTTAKVQCVGNWSILRFLQKYKVSGLNFKLTDSNQIVLCFKVPLNDNKISKVFLGVTIFKPVQSESETPISLKFPSIPGKMPEIPSSIMALRNIPILVTKATSRISKNSLELNLNKMFSDDVKDNSNTENKINVKNKKTIAKTKKPKINIDNLLIEKKRAKKVNHKSQKKSIEKSKHNKKLETTKSSINKPEIIEEPIIISEEERKLEINRQIDEILNSELPPELKEEDTVIAVSSQPIE